MLRNFVSLTHQAAKRDYLARVMRVDKAAAAEIACKFGQEYWDGSRDYGYGGYRYDGRWRPVAEAMVEAYGLKAGQRVLDVGCGKGFLLHDMLAVCPGLIVSGIDISDYAISQSPENVREFLVQGDVSHGLPWASRWFDLVISITTLHNLLLPGLIVALRDIDRVSRGSCYVCVEAYRTEREKANLLYWQLTCRAFHTPDEWDYIFELACYHGNRIDREFIYFD